MQRFSVGVNLKSEMCAKHPATIALPQPDWSRGGRRRKSMGRRRIVPLSILLAVTLLSFRRITIAFTPLVEPISRAIAPCSTAPLPPSRTAPRFLNQCRNQQQQFALFSVNTLVDERCAVVYGKEEVVDSGSSISLVDQEKKRTAVAAGEEDTAILTEAKSRLARKRLAMKNASSANSMPVEKTTKPKQSRSSTMPGFASTSTEKQRAFRDGIRLIEERTGRRYIDTPDKRKQRRKLNGEAMYKNSASVPDSLVQFATEIHQEERISRKEEIELGEKTQEAIRLQHLFDSLETRFGREPTDDEWCAAAGKINMAAIVQAIEEGVEAKNKLVTSNLRMVQSVVNTYIRNGLSSQYNAGDLMQEGIMALIRAAEKFEPDRGWKFSTYAMYWVRASVKRSQMYQSRIIPVPQRLGENYKRLKRIEKEMFASTGRRPSRKELGAAVGMTEQQVNRCLEAMSQRCFSLDQEIQNTLKPSKGDESKDTMIEIVESKSLSNSQNEFDLVDRSLFREDLVETLYRYLPPQEAEILLARYGISDRPRAYTDDPQLLSNEEAWRRNISDHQPTIAELSRMFNMKPDKLRRMIDQSLKHLNGVGLEEWLAFERDLP
jgi:RNA polymerase nonessential primary-like sigma factor